MKYFFIFIFIFFVGCASKEIIPLPDWVLNTPIDTSKYYGIGDGWSLQEAKNTALQDLISKLKVEISSSFRVTTHSSYDSFEKDILQEVVAKTKSIKIHNIKVEKTLQDKDNIYSLVSINKQDFIKQQKSIFLEEDKKINNFVDSLILIGIYERYIKLRNKIEILNSLKNNAYFIKSQDVFFDANKFISKYNRLIELSDKTKQKIIFRIKDNLAVSYFRDNLANFINTIGLRSSLIKPNVIVKMKHTIKYLKYKSWFTCKVRTTTQIIENNKVIFSKINISVGKSTISTNEALINASKKFHVNLGVLDEI